MKNRFAVLAVVILVASFGFSPAPSAGRMDRIAVASAEMPVSGEFMPVAMSAKMSHLRIFRLYTGADKRSHLEELKLAFSPQNPGEQSPLQHATGVFFTRLKPGTFLT